jgi:hypothetical protein
MTTPNPPSGQAVPTGPEHAAPHGVMGEIERGMDRIAARMIAEVRAVVTPARLQELALLTRELAAGAREAPEVLAWLAAHGL